MLQIENRTPFAANLAVFPNPAGVETAYGAVKASFELGAPVPRLAQRQAPFLAADVFWGDPAGTSLRAAGDVTLAKPATDILLSGRAVAPAPCETMDVRLRVGTLVRTIRVFGDRTWLRRGNSWASSDPLPFDRMPLRWELAFGGVGRSVSGRPPEHEPRNPVGLGFVTVDDPDVAGLRLPNLEDPADLIDEPYARPAPAGCAAVAPAWLPRRAYAGTYDEAWQRSRAPYLPADFDPRYLNVAPPGLVAAGFLAGGEEVEVYGCTGGDRLLQFCLPTLALQMQWDFAGQSIDATAHLDTVLIEPDFGRLQMVWRAELALDKRALQLRRLAIACPGLAEADRAAPPQTHLATGLTTLMKTGGQA